MLNTNNHTRMYRIFISHSWAYSSHYDKIESFLSDEHVNYYNHSIPKDHPVHTNGTKKQLTDAIEAKIKGCSCVIILAGVYASYSYWIDIEIELAQKYDKPIIAVEPWGSERTSAKVKNAANAIVGWNAKSVANAVKNHAIYQN
ncbi:MAG: TIR domain-containing protein [Bacteroidaceae bacterium]